ncbi:MAG: transglutaminase-like domain-containing protein [Bacteroidales bacterium]|nr:transglutaminase-like domain-containing protein [Bacteroidales bacterium]
MKKTAFLLIVLLVSACGTRKSEYVDWLYEAMPLPDSLQYPRSYWEANVAKTLEVRRRMDWDIPEREFRHFVLPLRVNNETLDDCRTVYADTLCRRVRGMSLAEAALEINHWCHEQATYEPSDGRTSAPMATVRRGVGRCGEESVLTVAALRAAGIPARQVYTPRWAHTDDNHAWVEVWVDGRWHFMGACEPAATLDNAWFNGPVSRAMLLHTKVYGDYQGDEDVILRTPCYTEINVIRGYVPARRNFVTVLEDGEPAEGATVSFHIYNYAEFYPVASYETGPDGRAALDTGLGDLLVWARKGDRFGFAKASGESVTVSLDHRLGERFRADLEIVPPDEHPIPVEATPEQTAANERRLAEEDAIRASHPHDNPELYPFLENYYFSGHALLKLLTEKDRGDVTRDVLEDVVEHDVGPVDPWVVSPRVELEHLRPFRGEVIASGLGARLGGADAVARWVRDSITVIEGRNPQQLRTSPIAVWRTRKADALGRDIFFVALCRAFGFPARLDGVTGKTQYLLEDTWVDVDFDAQARERVAPQGTVRLQYAPGGPVRIPEYYRHYTLSRLESGRTRLMEYEENGPAQDSYTLDEGYYLLTTGNRMADGSVLVHLEFFPVAAGRTETVPLVLRQAEDKLAVIGTMDPEEKFLADGAQQPQSLLSATGRGYFLLAVLGGADEPTSHALREMTAAAAELNAWGRPLVLLGDSRPEGLPNAVFGSDPEGRVRAMLGASSDPLPLVAVCDSFGRIVYLSKGYNTSLAADLRRVIDQCR